MTNSRSRIPLIAIAMCALAVASCTSKQVGDPSPATSAPVISSTSAPAASGQDVFTGTNACTVLDQLLAGQGFAPGTNKTARNSCTTSKLDAYGIVLSLDSVQGLDDLTRTDPGATATEINGRSAKQVKGDDGSCDVYLGVGDHARAGVLVTMTSASADGCPVATQLATKLEPLLPKTQ